MPHRSGTAPATCSVTPRVSTWSRSIRRSTARMPQARMHAGPRPCPPGSGSRRSCRKTITHDARLQRLRRAARPFRGRGRRAWRQVRRPARATAAEPGVRAAYRQYVLRNAAPALRRGDRLRAAASELVRSRRVDAVAAPCDRARRGRSRAAAGSRASGRAGRMDLLAPARFAAHVLRRLRRSAIAGFRQPTCVQRTAASRGASSTTPPPAMRFRTRCACSNSRPRLSRPGKPRNRDRSCRRRPVARSLRRLRRSCRPGSGCAGSRGRRRCHRRSCR